MKKLLLLFALGISLCANAQLTVSESGQVHIGEGPIGSSKADLIVCNRPNTTSTVLAPASGKIALGSNDNVFIHGAPYGAMTFSATSAINFQMGNQS